MAKENGRYKERKALPDSIKVYRELLKQEKDSINIYNRFLNLFGFNSNEDITKKGKDGKTLFGVFEFGMNKDTKFIELFGYCMNEYRTPWFDDNIGSFLILVETVTE